jgi:hypothetical protein
MSTLLEQASLVMIPSGYKEDVVYSQIPTNGSGDLSFTRASNGTRINSAGLVEVVSWNLLEQSQTFATSPWSKSAGTTLTSGQTDPNGGASAFRMQMSSANNYLASGIYTVVSGSIYTYTIYIKSNTGSNQSFRIIDGVRGVSGGVLTGTATTQWQRFEVQITPNSTSGAFQLDNAGGAYSNDLLIAFSQANIGSTAKPYFPTTDRLNVPRLTYQNGGGGCPSLLLEKQSTNLLTWSEDFTNAFYTKFQSSITANATTSPDGTANADKLIADATNEKHGFYAEIVSPSAGTYTQSAFFKAGEYNFACIRLSTDNDTKRYAVVLNLTTGAITSTDSSGSPTNTTSKVDNLGNGWFRLSVTSQHTSGNAYPTFAVSSTASPTWDNSLPLFTGNGASGIFVYGAQIEASSYPTSYIPTTSASATRVKDNCIKTGVSSLIGQTEGVVFVDFEMNGQSIGEDLYSNEKNLTGSISIQINVNGALQTYICYAGTFVSLSSSASTIQIGQRHKVALAYKSGSSVLYINGVQIATSTTTFAFTTTLSEIDIANNSVFFAHLNSKNINQVVQFKTRLTNAELASLTTI